MIAQLPTMLPRIAANTQLSICCIAGEHPELLQLVCSRPVFQSMTWTAITHKVAMSFWEQLTAADLNTEIKPHSQSKSFQLCNCVEAMAVG
jgi:hypothetical protein